MCFILLFMLKFINFPSRQNAIIQNHLDLIQVDSSGSIGQYRGGHCIQTFPNATLFVDEKLDWCSNIGENKENPPYVTYSLKGKAIKLTSYAVRSGCCYYSCCCIDDSKLVHGCCCELFSFSLQGSNDNITWTTVHSVEKDYGFYYCLFKEYELKNGPVIYRYFRFVLNEQSPGCDYCMAINQIEFYGEIINRYEDFSSNDADDESVSIIGKVKRDGSE